MLVSFAIFVTLFAIVDLVPMNFHSGNSEANSESSWSPNCSSGKGKIPLPVPNPRNCRSLFICSEGTLREYLCVDGTFFNPGRQKCMNDVCRIGISKPWPAFEVCPEDNKIQKYFRHPEDCAKFYQCSNGRAHLHQCDLGTFFNEKNNVCDWPENVDCRSRTFLRKS